MHSLLNIQNIKHTKY